ncbi:MAG TPA: VOC family protein, partial [Acidimicrobiia bacterium]|nr:VOC family protein [Acidimicrobiia bacterium]
LGLALDEGRSPLPDGMFFEPEQAHAYFFTVGEGATRIEMLVPVPGSVSGTARFLERRGPGLHHLAFTCEDLDAEAERLAAQGLVEVRLPRTADGRRTASFFHPGSVGGILTELVTPGMVQGALRDRR